MRRHFRQRLAIGFVRDNVAMLGARKPLFATPEVVGTEGKVTSLLLLCLAVDAVVPVLPAVSESVSVPVVLCGCQCLCREW